MIVITTPTGQIGRQVLANLLGSGSAPTVRVVARDPDRIPPHTRDRVDVIQGSMAERPVMDKALAGAEALFWLAPPDPAAEGFAAHVRRFAEPMCAAVADQGIARLVYVSALPSSPALDGMVERTGASFRALRMPAFMENLLQQLQPIVRAGEFTFPIDGDRRLPAVATRDIAAVAARLLLDGSWTGPGSVPILGPEDLSYNDMARIMSEVLGRPVRYRRVSGEEHRAILVRHGMSEGWARDLGELLAATDRGLYNTVPRTPASASPTTFRQWCQEVLAAAVEAADSPGPRR